jgi:hypothetical protein
MKHDLVKIKLGCSEVIYSKGMNNIDALLIGNEKFIQPFEKLKHT